jgi:hypothetical protein
MGFRRILGVMSAGLLVVPAVSCSRGVPSGAGRGDAAATSTDWIESAACGGRRECRLKSELWQTTDRGGSRAVVAVIRLAPAPAPRPGRYPFQDESTLPGAPIGHSWDDDNPTRAPECAPWETWLVSWTSTQAQRVRLLVSDCAADFGEAAPVVTDLGPDKVRYTRSDPLEGARSFDLSVDDPPRLDRETRGGGEDGADMVWDYTTFRGQSCERGECRPLLLEAPVADEAFAKGGWRTTGLGECGMLVDGITSAGDDTWHGGPLGAGATASVRALLSDGTLYVEVTDDTFVTHGPVVDTLVLESIRSDSFPTAHPRRERLRMDGMLTDWDGHVRQVEWAAGPSSRRFALKDGWPMPEDLWKLTYEDTDDGRKLGSRLAMSRTMERPFVFVSSEACIPRDGVLHVERDGATVPERAIVW